MKLVLKLLPPGQNAKINVIEFEFDHVMASNSQLYEIVMYKNQKTKLGTITRIENGRKNKWKFVFTDNNDKEQIMEVYKWEIRNKSRLFENDCNEE